MNNFIDTILNQTGSRLIEEIWEKILYRGEKLLLRYQRKYV